MAIGLLASLVLGSCSDSAVSRSTAPIRMVRITSFTSHQAVRISEIHYDNASTDAGERIEVSAPAGQDLTGWSLVLYNGSTGASYGTTALGALSPSVCGARQVVVVAYPSNGIQNGSPDGFALVDAVGAVVEFLSYEGTFVASGGPAHAMTSTDIGVSQNGTEPVGSSLYRDGAGAWHVTTPLGTNTFGACNDTDVPAGVVASVTVEPASATIYTNATQSLVARAFDAVGDPVSGVSFTWTSSNTAAATVDGAGMVTGVSPGSATITATAPNGVSGTAEIEVQEAPPRIDARINEIHYDNAGTDAGEAIEIEGPAGGSVNGWSVVLYNGNGGGTYNTRLLSGTIPATCGDRGVLSITYPVDGIQNGAPDGIALVDAAGAVVEFLSYEGVLTATNGPAQGMSSTDIGVSQTGDPGGRSLQRDAIGWYKSFSSFGACNPAPTPFVFITGRTAGDAPLPVGFEDQLFASYNDGRGNTVPAEFTWSSDTPGIASIDSRGVIRALAAGTAVLRALAPDGTHGTISLPTHVATASTTASYVGNTEFGEPSDGDPSDDFIVRRAQYTTSFNRLRGIPNWVSYDLEATHFGPQDRCDCFTFDPELPADFTRYNTADYTGAADVAGFGIDRGHLARSFDRTAGSLDNAYTYLFSNIIPQASDINQGLWANLENDLGDLARVGNKEVYIITGASGTFGTVKNEGRITIPMWTWKVAVIMPRDQGLANIDSPDDVEVIAVIMPNTPGIRKASWQEYETTVNAVEALSGYDVLALLDDRIEGIVESELQPVSALIDQLVAAGTLSRGNANSLMAKVEAAAVSGERGNRSAAVNQLDALLNEVDAMERSRRLSAPDAQSLRTAIMAARAALGS